jgi:uncharacterized protein
VQRWLRFRFLIPLFRSRHSPEFTARGVAIGVFWGMTPTVGIQTAAILGTWLALKVFRREASLVQALLWACVNNPVTMVPMYYGFYVTGQWLLGGSGVDVGYESFMSAWTRSELGWLERLTHAASGTVVPTVVGCLPFALIGSVLSYHWAVALVRRRRRPALVSETFRT